VKRVTAALAILLLAGPPARAFTVEVKDTSGESVADAVVYAVPLGADGAPLREPPPTAIDQIDKEYVPYVTAVRVGTRVSFPNRDQIRHHVYSFSEAKTFEIPLYQGTPREAVLFDAPGVVVLGCNIHDWMKAYVFVTESPYFSVTDGEGRAILGDLPARGYRFEVWHPRLKGPPSATATEVSVGDPARETVTIVIDQKQVWRPRRAPGAGDATYR